MGSTSIFLRVFEGKPAIHRMRIADQRLEPVADLEGLKPVLGYPVLTGRAPDDSPLASRDISSYEIYAFD